MSFSPTAIQVGDDDIQAELRSLETSDAVSAAVAWLRRRHRRVRAADGHDVSAGVWARVRRSLAIIALARRKWPDPAQLALSFNGGKDNCVLLHLVSVFWFCANKLERATNGGGGSGGVASNGDDDDVLLTGFPALRSMVSLYWTLEEGFACVGPFMAECASLYGLRVRRLEHNSFVEGLRALSKSSRVEGIFMGQRRDDPHAQDLDYFALTDPSWPPFTRINPLLDWTYSDVWAFILHQKLPICPLYAQGYTSLGKQHNTVPNPHLRLPDGSYQPAWKLSDDSLERAGRLK